MIARKSFELNCDIIHTIELLSNEEAGNVIKAILLYVNGIQPRFKSHISEIVFAQIRPDIDSQFNRCKSGPEHWNWKGGISPENKVIRTSAPYLYWRKEVFGRDGYTCTECGAHGGTLHAHHIKEFSKFPELRFDIDNGLTLCKDCHIKIHTVHGK